MKSHFTAGEASKALGLDPETLRQWRTRKYCLLGQVGDRGHWLYSEVDVYRMAVARALNRFGVHMAQAVSMATDNDKIVRALQRAIFDDTSERLSFAAGVGRHGEWDGVIVTNEDRAGVPNSTADPWGASDMLELPTPEFLTEQVWEIDLTRIVQRVAKLLGEFPE